MRLCIIQRFMLPLYGLVFDKRAGTESICSLLPFQGRENIFRTKQVNSFNQGLVKKNYVIQIICMDVILI